MKNLINRFVREDEGQDLIEYALLAALISIACIGAVRLVAGGIITTFGTVSGALPVAP